MKPLVFDIPAELADTNKAKVDKVIRRCVAKGIPIPVVSFSEPFFAPTDSPNRKEARVTVTVILNNVKFDGWSLLARLEHDQVVGTLIQKVPGVATDLTDFSNAAPHCDHCDRTNNRRKDTFLLCHETTGEIKQVGRQCIKDFLGHDVVRSMSFAVTLEDEFKEALGYGSVGRALYTTEFFATVAMALIRKHGFKPSGSDPSTREQLNTYLYPSNAMKDEAHDFIKTITDEDRKFALEAIAYWAKQTNLTNEFVVNANKIMTADHIQSKHFGFGAAACNSYLKFLGAESERKIMRDKTANSTFVGNVGERLTLEVTCVRVIAFDSMYGTVFVNQMIDQAGNVFVWKTGAAKLTEGQNYTVVGTVKKHVDFKPKSQESNDNYPTIKQTELSRCKVK